jgi:hypothetical protein
MSIGSKPTHPKAVEDLDDDVTAHSRRLPPSTVAAGDVDAHHPDVGGQPEPTLGSDDVAGHVSRGRGFTDEDDDVEGHGVRVRI